MTRPHDEQRHAYFPAAWIRLLQRERVVLAVVAAISAHINTKTGEAFPSRQTIAEMVGTTEREVTRAIARARELGLIDVRVGGGRRKTSTYTLREANLVNENRGSCHPGLPGVRNLGDGHPKTSVEITHQNVIERNITFAREKNKSTGTPGPTAQRTAEQQAEGEAALRKIREDLGYTISGGS